MSDPDRHLPVPDDDALDVAAAAVADGVATPEEEAAIVAAPDGPARVAAQRAAARAVGAPVGEQHPEAAARAMACALAAFGDERFHGDAPVTPVAALPRPRSRRAWPRIGAVAAALLLLLGIGAFTAAVLRSGGSQESATSAAPPPAGEATDQSLRSLDSAQPQPPGAAPSPTAAPAGPAGASDAARAEASARAAAPPPVVDGGELGRQDDVEAVALRVASAVNGAPSRALAAGDAALPREIQACATAGATTASEAVGALRYRATGTFQGAPAVFLAYDRPSGSPSYLLLVLARDGCSILATSHF